MNNPFENPNPPQLRHPSLARLRQGYSGQVEGGIFTDVSEPSLVKRERGGLTIIKGGIESPGYESRRQDLPSKVRSYADRLHARLLELYKKYGVTNAFEMQTDILSSKGPKLEKKDVEEVLILLEKLRYLLDRKSYGPGMENEDVLEKVQEDERKRLKKWFGKDISVPPVPEGVTKEMINFWRVNKFRLFYWPRIKLSEDDNYPGWLHKLGKRNNAEGAGIEFYDQLNSIKKHPQNMANPNLKSLDPDELPGCWVLADIRKVPAYKTGRQKYEKDSLVRRTLMSMPPDLLNPEAKANIQNRMRSMINPFVFFKPEFWNEFKKALKIDHVPGSIVRLPRVIEANAMGQNQNDHLCPGYYEWSEEAFGVFGRLVTGGRGNGGVFHKDIHDTPWPSIGFRPLVVFPPTDK